MTIAQDVYTLLLHDVPVPPLDRALEAYLISPSRGNLSPFCMQSSSMQCPMGLT